MLLYVLYLLVSDEGELGNLGGLVPPSSSQRERPPRSCKAKGWRRLPAQLKRVTVMLSSRLVSREKGIITATQGKRLVGNGAGWGTGGGSVGLCSHLHDHVNPQASGWAPFDHPNNACTNKSVHMS